MTPLRARLAVLFLASTLAAPAWAAPAWIPIAQARQQSAGTVVVVEGLVTVPSGDFRSSSEDEGFAVQDQTSGIWVSVRRDLGLRLGQRVRVRGPLGQSAGKLQIAADAAGVERLPGRDLRVATGQVGTATLGFLIAVEGTVTQPPAKDLPYGYKLLLDDGSGPVQIYLNRSTDIDPHSPDLRAGRRLRVTGFGNQYDATYEVDPRSRQDIRPLRGRRLLTDGTAGAMPPAVPPPDPAPPYEAGMACDSENATGRVVQPVTSVSARSIRPSPS